MKKVIAFILMLIAAFSIAGCGNGSDKIATIEELKTTPTNITFRVPFGTTIINFIEYAKTEFLKEYPNLTIEVEVVGGYVDMKKANIADINGGQAPTMTVGYPDHFAEYLITDSIELLDKYITDSNVGYTDDELSDFLPGYIQENRNFDAAGSYVGLPFNKSTEALYYNADFFDNNDEWEERFGVTVKVPATWAEFEETSANILTIVNGIVDYNKGVTNEADKLTYSWLGDIDNNLKNQEFYPCLYDSGGNFFTTIIHQFGGKYTSSIMKSNKVVDVQHGTLEFNTDTKAKESMYYLQDLAEKGYLSMPDIFEQTHGSYAFCVGKCIMNVGSTGGSTYYTSAICETGVAPIPYYDADNKYVIQQGTNVCIFSKSSNLEKLAAWLFIKHMLTPENTAAFAMATGYMPVRSSAYELEDYTDWLENNQTSAAKVHKTTARYAQEGWKYFVDAAWAGSANVRDECEVAITTIIVDKSNIEKALQDAVNRIG